MALNTAKCNYLTSLHFKGLKEEEQKVMEAKSTAAAVIQVINKTDSHMIPLGSLTGYEQAACKNIVQSLGCQSEDDVQLYEIYLVQSSTTIAMASEHCTSATSFY